jgi:hypothetical protein
MHQPPCSIDLGRSTVQVSMAIHELTPNNDHLTAINRTQTTRCGTRETVDTTQHLLTQCGVSQLIWNWTRTIIAAITCTNSFYLSETWTLRPDFHLLSHQRHNTIMRMLAHLVDYHMQGQSRIYLLGYTHFL